jgi:hypothetical protein
MCKFLSCDFPSPATCSPSPVSNRLPKNIFHSVRVVEFQGLQPATEFVSAGEVAIKAFLYGCKHNLYNKRASGGVFTMLPSRELDGLWEL